LKSATGREANGESDSFIHHSLESRKNSDGNSPDVGVSLGEEGGVVGDLLVDELKVDGSDGSLSVNLDESSRASVVRRRAVRRMMRRRRSMGRRTRGRRTVVRRRSTGRRRSRRRRRWSVVVSSGLES